MTGMAAQMGWSAGLHASSLEAAVTKQVASAAVQAVTAVAHAVHGAIGVTEEFPLQRYIKVLYSRRMAHGSESYWAGVLGAARFRHGTGSVDFVRGLG